MAIYDFMGFGAKRGMELSGWMMYLNTLMTSKATAVLTRTEVGEEEHSKPTSR